jgi:Cof subfamily protein (haloacid dehalogenase superfamily)
MKDIKNNFKIVACDVDGTLLDSKLQLSTANKKAIAAVIEMGLEFIIVTGRNDILVTDIVKQLQLKSPIIGCNGASVRDLESGVQYVVEGIDKMKLSELFRFLKQENVIFSGYSLDHAIYPSDFYEQLIQRQKKYFTADRPEFKDVVVDDIFTLCDYPDELIKICTFSSTENESARILEQLKQFHFIDAFRPTPFVIDIVSHGVSKGNALKAYAEKMAIDKTEIIAFGDGENDISMLQYAGIGVAMKNSAPAVFAHADMVTLSNDQDGVAKVLKELIIHGEYVDFPK